MITNLFDEIFAVKISKNFSGYRSIDLEFIADDGNGKSWEPWSFLSNSLICFLIEEYGIVKLFLYLDLSPTLLLCFTTSFLAGCGC